MYHIVYKTTNLINGKHYIGVHSTKQLDDGYLGSGVAIRRAIKKHGSKNFVKEILFFGFSKQDAFEVEREMVTRAVTLDPNTYNLAVGGSGNSGMTKRSRIIDIYNSDLQYVCSKESYVLATDFVGLTHPGCIRKACLNAEAGLGSKAGKYYVCHQGSKPCLKVPHAPDHMKRMHQKAVKLNTGKSRPEHSELMKQLNKARRDPTVYNFQHKTGITFEGTRADLMEAFPDHNISRTELGVMIKGRYKSHKGWSLGR